MIKSYADFGNGVGIQNDNLRTTDTDWFWTKGAVNNNNVQFAWGCLVYDHNAHSLNYMDRRRDMDVYLENYRAGKDVGKNEGKDWSVVSTSPIRICHDAWIGANVTILKGVTIGAGTIIGAGSVVREDIPAYSIAYGNPCRVVATNRFSENTIS